MHNILPRRLWIGNARDLRDIKQIYDHEISAVVDLAYEEPTAVLPRDLVYCRFPLSDDGGNQQALISAALQACRSLLEQKIPTVIGCSAGISRSPAMAAAALAIVNDVETEEMLELIREHQSVDLSPAFWNQILKAFSEEQ